MEVTCSDYIQKPICGSEVWEIEPQITFLNHGSFGSCPRTVLEYQTQMRKRMERQPVQFFVRDLEKLLDNARSTLAKFIGADEEGLVFVPNATYGVNSVLRSLKFEPSDELLVTDNEYNACRNALNYAAQISNAQVVVAEVPFPLKSPDQVVDTVVGRITQRTKLLLIDHITSQTGLIFPIERIINEAKQRAVAVLVDGAHAPGMIKLNLKEIGADFYTGNCHKWLCAPKGSAFLYVSKEWRGKIRPLAISHGANSPRTDRSKYLIEFDWTGTWDPSAYLSIPEAIRYVGSLMRGGWTEIMERNRNLAILAREHLCKELGIEEPAPRSMLGSLASLPLPDSNLKTRPTSPLYADPLQTLLWENYKIEVPVIPWHQKPKRLIRISAQLYNSLPQYEFLARSLKECLAKGY